MKKLNIPKMRTRLFAVPVFALMLGACSDDPQASDSTALKANSLKNMRAAIEQLNTPENFDGQSGLSELELNHRRAALLVNGAKDVLLAHGRTQQDIDQMVEGKIVTAAFQIYVKQQKSVTP